MRFIYKGANRKGVSTKEKYAKKYLTPKIKEDGKSKKGSGTSKGTKEG
jgi:hypothetical protein